MNTAMYRQPDADDIATFQRDGVICLRGAFDTDWIELLKQGLAKSMEAKGEFVWNYTHEADGRHFHNENRRWHEIEEYRRFMFESPVAALIGTLMGWKQASLLFDSAFLRTPGTATRTPWHQDLPYLCIDGEDALCSAWTPLYPVGRESTLECVRGSHRWSKKFFRLNFDPAGGKGHMDEGGDDEEDWDEVPDIDADRSAFDIAGYAMEPGDCLVLHGMILHGSAGNLDKTRNLAAFTTRVMGDNAVYRPDKPGGVQPDLGRFAKACGLEPGAPVRSELFPQIWAR